MFRRLRHKKWLVAGLGVALLAPASAAAGNHNMSTQANNALVAKGQAMNQRYAIVAQGEALNERYSGSHGLSYQADQALLAKGQAMNQRYASAKYGQPDGWYPYAVSLTRQQENPVADGRSPDTIDAAITSQADRLTPVDGRSPDTVDFAVQAHSPVVTVTRDPGFHWGDFAIGLGAALAAVALFGVTRLFSGRGQRPVASN